ncbi:hypothetical protein [Reyranella sp.]|uniref:hypothetical protein n=1 Tax=Reyranella sp. TaxID=1929291 RepID=UPI00403501FE
MSDTSIRTEVRAVIEEKISAGVAIRADWVAVGILETKSKVEGDDAEFYRVCAYNEIRRIAKEVLGKWKATDETPAQLVLPGFTHLCKAYPMERDGEVVLVPVDQCSASELLLRAEQLDEMAAGCRAHAKEIRAYLLAKSEAA